MISKSTSYYVPHPVRGERCDTCSMFVKPQSCTLVRGKIAARGHCRYWEPKRGTKK